MENLIMLRRSFLTLCASLLVVSSMTAQAELPADFKTKADNMMPNMNKWAADPAVIAAAKAGATTAGMSNAKWSDLAEGDAVVTGLSNSALSKQLATYQKSGVGKLIVRDKEGNLVAFAMGAEKPFLYNIANRPNFKAALAGADFVADKVAPDPSSQKASVQIAVPIKDGGAIVGVLQASLE
jgi:hypothetical protein